MVGVLNSLRGTLRRGGLLVTLVVVNVVVFVVVRFSGEVAALFGVQWSMVPWLGVSSEVSVIVVRGWTVVSYMFVHYDFLHVLFNLLWLWWFGRVFLGFFSERQLLGVYLMGGVCGAGLYVLAYNLFPLFEGVRDGVLIGASAAVMGIVFGAAFYRRDLRIRLLLIGEVRIFYIALFCLGVDLLSVAQDNSGGHFAHIGGAVWGIVFALACRRGWDLTGGFGRVWGWLAGCFGRRRKMGVRYGGKGVRYGGKRGADYEYNARKKAEEGEIDLILDKIRRSGYGSLNEEEKRRLFDASRK